MALRKFFYNLTIADIELIQRTNGFARNMRVNLGIFVLLTSVFAFFSGYYALTMIFGYWDPISNTHIVSIKMQVVCVVIAFFYALMILMIDKMIVADTNKWIILLRLPLAIIIGLVIAVPLKLKIMEDEITKEIYRKQLAPRAELNEAKDKLYQQYDEDKRELEMMIRFHQMKADEAREIKNAEHAGLEGESFSGKPGRGLRYRIAAEEESENLKRIKLLNNQINEKKLEYENRLNALQQNLDQTSIVESHGLWARYMMLGNIIHNDTTGKAKMMVWGISLLFVMFELLPSIMKLLGRKTEYDMLLDYTHKQFKKKLDYFLENESKSLFTEDEAIHLPKTRYATPLKSGKAS
ncbi:MAG: DUF4407 domain-containing protein [Weeksellaceae bacterium]|nr:DUF4407 domain-containing protein [Weeksellaceae bacterium]